MWLSEKKRLVICPRPVKKSSRTLMEKNIPPYELAYELELTKSVSTDAKQYVKGGLWEVFLRKTMEDLWKEIVLSHCGNFSMRRTRSSSKLPAVRNIRLVWYVSRLFLETKLSRLEVKTSSSIKCTFRCALLRFRSAYWNYSKKCSERSVSAPISMPTQTIYTYL